jgi:hypothetical protein
MLILVNQKNERKKKFKDYKDLYGHIDRSQQMKRMRDPKLMDEWVFTIHPYQRLAIFSAFVYRQMIIDEQNAGESTGESPGESKAQNQKKLDVLEISCNQTKNPVFLHVTPDVDIEVYRKDWCQRYCQYHGFELREIQEKDGVLRVKRESDRLPNLEADDGEGGQAV